MNRLIKSMAAAAVIIGTTTVSAEQWINISSWSYNDVSSFVSAGLLPESLEYTGDYRQPITRLQFCDIIEAVIKKTKTLYDLDVKSEVFCDTASDSSASFLYAYGIVEGVTEEYDIENRKGQIYSSQNIKGDTYFYPELNITREDAAVIIYRTGRMFGSEIWYSSEIGTEYDDASEISDYAAEAVGMLRGIGIVTDMENNMFCPKSDITIEQALIMANRMYSSFSKIIESDYDGIVSDGTENKIKSFENGLFETYDGKMLRIKDNGNDMLELEADVYSVVNCAEYGGKRMAFAINFNDKTDVYDIDTGEVMYEIPYIVTGIDKDNGYVYTVSSRWYPVLYGLYSMDGQEIIKPDYSETEIEELERNGFSMPKESYREPDGIMYYSDKSDGYSLYRVDTNGENREKLSDISSYDISYYDERLFFGSYDDSALHIIDTDGTDYKNVSLPDATLLYPPVDKWGMDANGIWQPENNAYKAHEGMKGQYAAQGYAFATDGFHRKLYSINMNSEAPQLIKLDEGAINDCLIGEGCIYYLRNTEDGLIKTDGITKEQLTPGYKIKSFGYACADGRYDESRILFTVFESDKLYEYDIETGEIKELNGYNQADTVEIDIYAQFSDEEYRFDERMDGKVEFSVWTGNGNKEADISGILYKREGNKIIYENIDELTTGKNEHALVLLDLDTKEEKVITDDLSRTIDVYDVPDSIMYADTKGMVYIYNEVTGVKTVLPCNGIYRYGKLLSLETLMPENSVYKLDVNGRFCRLTEGEARDMIYVPNS